MIHFTTLLALVIGGMEVIQLAAAWASTGPASVNAFQRRQTTGSNQVPSQCESTCNPVISFITSGNCIPSQCCVASFETSYFDCFMCLSVLENLTNYTTPQSFVDEFYDACVSQGFQLPILTYPGQNSNRTLSSFVPLPSSFSQATITSHSQSTITPVPPVPSQVTTTALTTTANSPTPTANSPNPTQTLSSGTKSVGPSYSDLIASAMMLGTMFYFAL
ncbi:hypothetical protein BYT27DRAFT_7195282 [Phlegmacium glaucopus]|nr:hypothetical protein BYT27DRAFT_7195282 [Phlegmacium glaucopus]